MVRAYPPTVREAVRLALEQRVPPADIAERSGISARTVRRYRQRLKEHGHLQPTPHPGRPRLIPEQMTLALTAQLRQYSAASLAQHCHLWEAHTGVQVSSATMSRSIRRLGWSRRRQRPGRMA
jgi:transposase